MSVKKRGAIVQLIAAYTNTAFAIISGLFFVPLYFKYIDINTYGSWLASGNILNMLSIIEGGVAIVFSQQLALFYGENDHVEFANITGSGILISTIIAILIILSTISLAYWVPYWVKADALNSSAIKWAFIFAGIGSALSIINSSIVAVPRAWHVNEYTSIIALIASILGLLAIFFSIVYFNLGVMSLGLGAFVRALSNLLGNTFYIFFKWRFYCEKKPKLIGLNFKMLLVTTIPVFGSNLLGALLNNSKELLLAILINPASASILSITSRLFGLVTMVINPISFSLYAALASISTNRAKLINLIFKLFATYNLLSGILFGLAVALNYWFVSFWVGVDKFGGIELTVFLGVSAWLTTKCNMNIMLLNVQSIFKPTAFISLGDIVIRFLLIGIIILTNLNFKIIYLPIIECISVSIAVLFLEFNLSKSLEINSRSNFFGFKFFYSAIQFIIISVFIYFISIFCLPLLNLGNSLIQFSFASFLSLIALGLFVFSVPNNRKTLIETFLLLKIKKV